MRQFRGMKPSIFSLFCFFTLLNLSVQSQNSVISGKVIDKETKQPIPGANVYLSDTVVGASTDENGMYSFKTDLSGDYTLSVTFVGYSSKNNPLLLEQNIDIVVNFELVEATLQLDQIEISGSDKKWAKQIAQFKDFFLGTDEFATITFIENPEVINFEETGADNTLSVSSLEPLIINNHALGYKISVQFGDVRFDPFSKIGSYVVFPRFSEMETTSTRQQKIWEKNRKASYIGSSRHFFKSLVDNKVRTNRFAIFPDRDVIEEMKNPRVIQSLYPYNWREVLRNYTTFMVTDLSLAIGHNVNLDRGGNPENLNQLSNIDIKGAHHLLIINDLGLLYDPSSVELKGKWSRDRFAKHLPLGYTFN